MSSAPSEARSNVRPANEWTIMVFFAGNPHLSPSMTAQLKAIKDAGFQENTSVLVHYDPNERGIAVSTFDINRKRKEDLLNNKQKGTRIGDGKDPFVRNLLEDAINGATKADTAEQALRTFLDIGARDEYRAKHYVIFLVGHGVIVGNDAFLPDSTPQSGITLEQLGDALRHFKGRLEDDAAFELIGLHSCSMSAIEVIFELKDTAKYMMATQGASFVDSWPYRQLLKKILNAVDDTKTEEAKDNDQTEVNVDKLITSIHGLSLHNSTDFIFSGLSADLCLSSLDRNRVEGLRAPIENLARDLKRGLKPPPDWDPKKEWRGAEMIKLAHLEAQSYYQETYTDLYDFCLCLRRRCDNTIPPQKAMKDACDAVMRALEETADDPVVVQSDHFGPLFQYSHGLSIFFPWSRPIQEDPSAIDDTVLNRYEKYEFTKMLGADSWLSFLDDYFTDTQRKSREDEDGKPITAPVSGNRPSSGVIGATGAGIVNSLAPVKDSPALAKDSPSLTDGCGCSVKNYPMRFSISPRVAEDPNPDATERAKTTQGVASTRP
ncbi:MAG TPA: clostripain-related cysteine peptidase [Pyrinomonadaceae bacterium]|nr:clostripain-related cysteine peptidase [Pyrinomonadaceae bacterium]